MQSRKDLTLKSGVPATTDWRGQVLESHAIQEREKRKTSNKKKGDFRIKAKVNFTTCRNLVMSWSGQPSQGQTS